jgi:hypothetical protein
MREVVSITSGSYQDGYGESGQALYALCDDSSMWVLDVSNDDAEWMRIKDIPQD